MVNNWNLLYLILILETLEIIYIWSEFNICIFFWLTEKIKESREMPVKTGKNYLCIKCYNYPSFISSISIPLTIICSWFCFLAGSQSSPAKNSCQHSQKQTHHLSPQLLSNQFFSYEFLLHCILSLKGFQYISASFISSKGKYNS